jgi:hypothetical protein
VKLRWRKITTHAEAEHALRVLYLFTKNSVVRYVGRAKQLEGTKGRYAHGYRYLIDLLWDCDFELYVSQSLSKVQWENIVNIERSLIALFDRPQLKNRNFAKANELIEFQFIEPWKRRTRER